MRILTVNAGSSSLKLALFELGEQPAKISEASIEKIGHAQAGSISDHVQAAKVLLDRLGVNPANNDLACIGHRVVHGGPKYYQAGFINDGLIEYLGNLTHFDPEHLPVELELIDFFKRTFPAAKPIACFDTAFHHDLPTPARVLAIPRRYEAVGVRRYGFHGLSFTYLMDKLRQEVGEEAAKGRLILAHMGHGVSLAAVHGGKSIDTTMAMTPAAGVPMSSRSGDLDPGLALYLARTEGMDAEKFNEMVNFHSGLLGISESSSDMQHLLELEAHDEKAREAIELFCYQVRKAVGSLVAALGGLDTLVFSGGMGENAPKIRYRICDGLQFLGLRIDESANDHNAGVISGADSRVGIRVIHADEAATIAAEAQKLMSGGNHAF